MRTPPEWIDRLVQHVSSLLRSHEGIPVGCHLHEADDCWEISIFTMRVEVLGGSRDGERLTLPFHVDLSQINGILDETESLSWQTARLGRSDDLGPHISLLGRSGNHRVWIRILAEAPAGTPSAGMFCARSLDLLKN
jgi:hypothetical protein